ncbi:TonB-dependent siderophore receptor [Phyllobacterium sp. SB3]|uniref:TonB-dependent siderophore receptor n=1 Tax=Phyllobacterium sp. SB3 TaxID=3156073 RepID=UPI0032AF7518
MGNNIRQAHRRQWRVVLVSCTALVVFAPAKSLAQQAENTGPGIVLDTITIDGRDDDSKSIVATKTSSGSKMATDILDTPASVSVITAKEMQQRGAQSVEQALQYTAGVSTDFYGSDDRFDFFKIRGFDAYTYRDGLPLGRPFGGLREEVYAYDRVEVLKGANSTIFGVSDPGGSVNYVTKKPKSEKFGEAYVTGGSYNRKEVGFDFGDNLTKDNTLSYRLTGKFRDADAEYDYSRDDEKFFIGGLTWRPTDMTSLTVVFDHLHRNGVPGSGGHPVGSDFSRSRFFGEPDYNYRGTDRNTVSVMFDHDFGNGFSFNSNARYSDAKTDFGYAYIASTPNDGSTIARRDFFGNESSNENFVIDGRLQYEVNFKDIESRTLVGVEYNKSSSSNGTYYGPAGSIDWNNPVYSGGPANLPLISSTRTRQNTKAVYIQQDLTFAEKLIATVGLRNDWLDIEERNRLNPEASGEADLSELTSRFGLTYKLTDEMSIYASYAESVAPPTVGLDPEEGEQYEVGVKYQPTAFPALFTASVYELTKNNITVTDPVTSVQSTIGEVRVRGLDLEAKAEITDSLSLTAAYSYLDSEIVENGGRGDEGNRPSFVSKHQGSLWANYKIEGSGRRGDVIFGLGSRYTGSYYFDNGNTTKTKGNVVVDASFSYEFLDKSTLDVNVSNLFDKKYVAYGGFGADFYNPGREIAVSLRRTW